MRITIIMEFIIASDPKTLVVVLQIIIVLTTTLVYASFKQTANKSYPHDYFKTTPEPSGRLPVIGHLHLVGGRDPVARTLGAMADRHGPVFSLRLGSQRALVVSGSEAARECLATNDRLFADRPATAIGKYVGYGGAAFAVSSYGDYWRNARKLAVLHLLSARCLHSSSAARVSEIDSFVARLHKLCQSGGEVNVGEELERATFSINARLVVGQQSGESLKRRFMKAIQEALYLSGVFVWSDAVPWLEPFDVHGHVASMKRVFRELDFVLRNWLDQHRPSQACQEIDLMGAMLETFQEDHPALAAYPRDTVIKATSLILMLTGSESTSVTLTWAISLLLNHPSVLKSAQQELDRHVGPNRWAQESDLESLGLLKAIVKETLRLYPPGPLAGPRVATDDCHVAGHFVPKGTRLIVNIWKIQRDARVWAEPDEFRPGRFLGRGIDAGFDFGYIPFGSGRRSCPGSGLGLLVVELILARLVQGFDMRTHDGKAVDMREGLGIALPKLNPLKLLLSPRLPDRLYV